MESRILTLNGRITAVAKDNTIIADSMEWELSPGRNEDKRSCKRVESKKFNVEGSGMEVNSEQKVRKY